MDVFRNNKLSLCPEESKPKLDYYYTTAAAGANPRNYRPSPADMTNLTLSKDMMNLAERLSEDAHDTQALQRIRYVRLYADTYSTIGVSSPCCLRFTVRL